MTESVNDNTATDQEANVAAGDDMVLKYGDYSVRVGDVVPKGIAYLLQNGFSQSLTDAAAFSKEQKRVKLTDAVKNADGTETAATYRDMTDDEVAAMAKEKRDARFHAILKGEVGFRAGGPKGSKLDTIMRTVATERLRAKLAKHNVTLPTGDKTLTVSGKAMTRADLIAAEIAKYDADVRAEAQRRLDATKGEADLSESIDDII